MVGETTKIQCSIILNLPSSTQDGTKVQTFGKLQTLQGTNLDGNVYCEHQHISTSIFT